MSFHQQQYRHNLKPRGFDPLTKPAMTSIVVFSSSSFLNSSVLSGWVEKAMVTTIGQMSARVALKSIKCKVLSLLSRRRARLLESTASSPLRVDGPIDDVEEDVRTRKQNPRVLVYGVGVDPDVHVASGWPDLACDLRVIQGNLGQHPIPATAVLRHPIIPRCVDIHGPVASDLGVDHHLVRVANAARTRQLERHQGSYFNTFNLFI